mmetsp:Transcript_25098/g.58181  ORF Transcript_25098/g.58181 Transcript_25098/m.58181 type:complete len:209 (+) Transcript_25098:2944-3570(+)
MDQANVSVLALAVALLVGDLLYGPVVEHLGDSSFCLQTELPERLIQLPSKASVLDLLNELVFGELVCTQKPTIPELNIIWYLQQLRRVFLGIHDGSSGASKVAHVVFSPADEGNAIGVNVTLRLARQEVRVWFVLDDLLPIRGHSQPVVGVWPPQLWHILACGLPCQVLLQRELSHAPILAHGHSYACHKGRKPSHGGHRAKILANNR